MSTIFLSALKTLDRLFVVSTTIMAISTNQCFALPPVVGWQELVQVLPGNPKIEATLDPGDETSSLYVNSYRKISPESEQDNNTLVSLDKRSTAPKKKIITAQTDASLESSPFTSIATQNPPTTSTIGIKFDKNIPISSNQKPKKSIATGSDKVRFELSDRFGNKHTYEVPILRALKIKLNSGKTQIRPVIPIKLCLGSTLIDLEVSLRRSKLTQNPLRIGRNDLAGKVLIDPAKSFTAEARCKARL